MRPADPVREGYFFDGWTCGGDPWSFAGCTVTEDVTLEAQWRLPYAYSVIFDHNYAGGTKQEMIFTEGQQAGLPSPQRAGYVFVGWYLDADCTEPFRSSGTWSDNLVLYAKWVPENGNYVFEAEYTELEGKQGVGYSSGVSGTDMIVHDVVGDIGASNGYWVSYLYYNEAFLEFKIDSDKAVEDATLDLRLSVEFYDFVMNPSNVSITVNGEALRYSDIALNGAIVSEDEKRPFEDYKIATGVSLKEGENIIRITVTNTAEFEIGTMQAYAPSSTACTSVRTRTSPGTRCSPISNEKKWPFRRAPPKHFLKGPSANGGSASRFPLCMRKMGSRAVKKCTIRSLPLPFSVFSARTLSKNRKKCLNISIDIPARVRYNGGDEGAARFSLRRKKGKMS